MERKAQAFYSGSRLSHYIDLIRRDGAPEPSIDEIIAEAAKRYGLPEALIHGLSRTENAARNPEAISPKGAIGLLQIMPFNAKRCGTTVGKLFEPKVNIFCGAQILKEELEAYKFDVEKALFAYNGGTNCVKNSCPESVQHAARVIKACALHLVSKSIAG